MRVVGHPDADSFRARSRHVVAQAESTHNLVYGLASVDGARLWTVENDDGVQLIGLQTPGRKPVLGAGSQRAAATLARTLADQGLTFDGVGGPSVPARAFALEWPGEAKVVMSMRIHELRAISPGLPAPGGELRAVRREELSWIVGWVEGFQRDIGQPHRIEEAVVAGRIERGELFAWEVDRRAVSICGWSRPTPRGVCVSLVYTPPDERGSGWATAAVAELSRRLLARAEREFVCLFTDLANPTSNAIYARIGYRGVCDWDDWAFST